MQDKSKFISILTIICLCSVILIPIGLALMWFFTEWNNKKRIIITIGTTSFFISLVVVLMLLEPSYNTSGVSLPFGSNSGYTEFESNSISESKNSGKKKNKKASNKENNQKEFQAELEDIKPAKETGDVNVSRWIYSILFFLFMLFLIIWQNLKASKKKTGYENPYVDTSQYKLPLTEDAKMPLVHFVELHLNQNEKILFATETNQKDNEGDFVITNQRIVIYTSQAEVEFPVKALENAASASNSVLMLNAQNQKYYIFLPEGQLKYALAVATWANKKALEN